MSDSLLSSCVPNASQLASRLPLLAAYLYSFRSTSPWVRRHWRYRFHTAVTSVLVRGALADYLYIIQQRTPCSTAVFAIYCVTQRYWLDQDLALILLDACFAEPVSWNRLSEAIGYCRAPRCPEIVLKSAIVLKYYSFGQNVMIWTNLLPPGGIF